MKFTSRAATSCFARGFNSKHKWSEQKDSVDRGYHIFHGGMYSSAAMYITKHSYKVDSKIIEFNTLYIY